MTKFCENRPPTCHIPHTYTNNFLSQLKKKYPEFHTVISSSRIVPHGPERSMLLEGMSDIQAKEKADGDDIVVTVCNYIRYITEDCILISGL